MSKVKEMDKIDLKFRKLAEIQSVLQDGDHCVSMRYGRRNNKTVGIYKLSEAGKSIDDDVYQRIIESDSEVFGKKVPLIVQRILQSGGDVNYQVPTSNADASHEDLYCKILGYTALHFAVRDNCLLLANFLLNNDADFTIKDNKGFTALHLAIQTSYIKNVNCLALQGTLKHPIAELILNAHADKGKSSNPTCPDDISHFEIACMLNNVKAVEYFLKNGVSVNKQLQMNSKFLPGFTPLHFAARYCSVEVAQLLLKHKADRHVLDAEGMSPLHILIKYKMEIADSKNMEILADFPWFDTELVRIDTMIAILLNGNSNETAPIDNIGLTYLHVICTSICTQSNDDVMSKIFKKQSKNLDARIKSDSVHWPGYTPLHFAAHFNFKTVLFLVKQGADVLAKDKNGVTPLDLYIERYKVKDVIDVFKEDKILSEIKLTDNSKLTDVLSLLCFPAQFETFLNNQDNHILISENSPLWPSYSLMHLATIFTKCHNDHIIFYLLEKNDQIKSKKLQELIKKQVADISNVKFSIKKYVNNRNKKILQAADGMTPIHLAFKLKNSPVCLELAQGLKKEYNFSNKQNLSHLHIACIYNCEEAVKKCLTTKNLKVINSCINSSIEWYSRCDGKSIKVKAAAGSTALHLSIMANNSHYVPKLLEKGADIFVTNEDGLSPIHLTFVQAYFGNHYYSLSSLLMESCKRKENIETKEGFSYFHISCFNGNDQVIQSFLNLGVDINKPITCVKSDTQDIGITNYEKRKVNTYTNASDLTNILNSSFDGFTSLHIAVKYKNLKVVELLVENGADVFSHDDKGLTPLLLAYTLHRDDILSFFLRKFWKGEIKYKNVAGFTLLHLACYLGEEKVVKKLLKSGKDPNACISYSCPVERMINLTPLHCLMFKHRYKFRFEKNLNESILNLLLEHGADVTIKNSEHGTPVHLATDGLDKYKIDSILLESQKNYKINPFEERYGTTHFHIACKKNIPKIIKQFLENGVDVNHTKSWFNHSRNGATPLHIAMDDDLPIEIVKLLLKKGANVNAKDATGSTPLHYARKLNKFELLLRTCKIDLNAQNIYGESIFEKIFKNIYIESDNLKLIELITSLDNKVNTYNSVSGFGLLAKCLKKRRFPDSLKLLINKSSDITSFDKDEGRNAIQNIVSITQIEYLPSETYLSYIKILISKGCNLNHQDYNGKTALHTSVGFLNATGVDALLMAGADINICDNNGKTCFEYCVESNGSHRKVLEVMIWTLKKLLSYDLYVSKAIQQSLASTDINMEMFQSEDCDEEEIGAKSEKLTEQLRVFDLLSEKFVACYPTIPKSQRKAIDEFFSNKSLHVMFPELSRFFYLQRYKALQRLPLIEPAKVALIFLSNMNLPDLCLDIILKNLRNNDLKTIIDLNLGKSCDKNNDKSSENGCEPEPKRRKVQ